MSVRKVPEKFCTSDGCKFDNQLQAENHEALIESREKYKEALRWFAIRLAKSQTTADGVPFALEGWRNFYAIVHTWSGGLPRLRKLDFSMAYWQQFEIDEDDSVSLVFNGDDGKKSTWKVQELYSCEKAAKKALLVEQEEQHKRNAEEIEKLRAEVFGSPM